MGTVVYPRKGFRGTLEDFLDHMDVIDGMKLRRTIDELWMGRHPLLRLYHDAMLVGSTSGADTRTGIPFVSGIAYRFVNDLRTREPSSVQGITCQQDWLDAEIGVYTRGFLPSQLDDLARIGVLRKVSAEGIPYLHQFAIETLHGFGVDYSRPVRDRRGYN